MKNELVKVGEQLPATIEGLHEFIIIGKEKLNALKAKIRAIEKLDKSQLSVDGSKQTAIEAAEYLLCAEAKMGEMLKKIEPEYSMASIAGSNRPQREKTLPEGMTHKESHFAQTLADNPDVVEQTVSEAKERGRIPTSWDVLKNVYKLKKKKPDEKPLTVAGKYSTVVIDPPWPIEKVLRKERPCQTPNLDYPTKTIEAIKSSQFPFADDCHIYLWTTQKYLPIAFECFQEWNVKYVQTLVWHKNVGFTPQGLFMNNAEFVLFGRKGSLPLIKAGEKVVFNAKVREHSRKPNEFYDLVRKVSPEPRIDCFSREKRDGFSQFGNETDRF